MENTNDELNKIVAKLKEDLKAVRTGRVSASIVENILVDYYGTKTPLKQIANISAPDARLIVVEPWSKENMKDIVAAISASSLGVNPASDGIAIKMVFPPMSQEEREKTVKLMSQRVEKAKVAIRTQRDEARDAIKESEKNKEIGKDEKFRMDKDLQKTIDEKIKEIETLADEKEKEIMTI